MSTSWYSSDTCSNNNVLISGVVLRTNDSEQPVHSARLNHISGTRSESSAASATMVLKGKGSASNEVMVALQIMKSRRVMPFCSSFF